MHAQPEWGLHPAHTVKQLCRPADIQYAFESLWCDSPKMINSESKAKKAKSSPRWPQRRREREERR